MLQSIIEDAKPEAVYFYPNNAGERSGSMVVNLEQGVDLPKIGEALFLALNASVTMRPCFGLDDMAHFEEAVGPVIQKYG